MLFRKASSESEKVEPSEITDAGLAEWYASLSKEDRVKLGRYMKSSERTLQPSGPSYMFLYSAASAALADENYPFSAFLCEECLKNELSDTERFSISELLIDAYIGTKRYDDAKHVCEKNLDLYDLVSEFILKDNNGSLPENIRCRNRYIDIVVGIESGYDEAFRLLDRFFAMNLINREDLEYRKQSLKIHRLQRSFDGVYTYSYKK